MKPNTLRRYLHPRYLAALLWSLNLIGGQAYHAYITQKMQAGARRIADTNKNGSLNAQEIASVYREQNKSAENLFSDYFGKSWNEKRRVFFIRDSLSNEKNPKNVQKYIDASAEVYVRRDVAESREERLDYERERNEFIRTLADKDNNGTIDYAEAEQALTCIDAKEQLTITLSSEGEPFSPQFMFKCFFWPWTIHRGSELEQFVIRH